ncbi:MAG: hypothetical protein HDP34_00165 [Clostridia bacterium]|nr:hypothetical protein [Clostridia bacterium]
MTKTKKLSAVIALCVASAACAVTGGLLLNKTYSASAEQSYTLVSEEGDRIAYGAGWGAEASQKVKAAFTAKLNTDSYTIKLYKDNGAGEAVAFAVESGNNSYIYNVLEDKVYTVNKIDDLAAKIRVIGAPVTDAETGVTVTGGGYEQVGNQKQAQQINVTSGNVQVFETGIIVENGGTSHAYVGVVEKTADKTYKIYPLIDDQDILAAGRGSNLTVNGTQYGFIGDVDGQWHALRTARASHVGDELVVKYNFRAGCIDIKYNYNTLELNSRRSYAGQNFDKNGNRVNLPVENYTTDEHLWEGVTGDALSMYQSLSGTPGATENDLKDLFRQGYLDLVNDEEHGVIPGYRCSSIKTWSFVVCDYKYSPDSEYNFDSGRVNMFTLVYSGVQNKVYGVGDDFWQAWKEDNIRPQLGAPMSNVLYNHKISGVTYERVQIFEKGYIYGKLNGPLVTETGVTTDKDYTEFKYEASPAAPSEYGVQVGNSIEKTENGRAVYYFNYQKGAAKATQMAAKVGYFYDYYPGRNFVEENGTLTAKLLSYDKLYSSGSFTLQDNTFPGVWESGYSQDGSEYIDGVQDMIINKVKALLEDGFFPGFPDGGFRTWNDVFGTQFIYGDSTATPFGGDARTNVCALMYNESLNNVFLVKDAFMDAWGGDTYKAHQYLGAPAGDEFTLESNASVHFQYYNGKTAQNNKAFAVCTGYNAATWYTPNNDEVSTVTPERYLDSLKELSKPLTSVKLTVEDYDLTVDGYASLSWEIEGAWADATVTFKSSDDSIAEVMDDGSVEFLKKGKVTITISITDGVNTVEDSVTFTVK